MQREKKAFDQTTDWTTTLIAVLYLFICVANFFLLDRYVPFKDTRISDVSGYMLFSDEDSGKITRLHRCVLDERRKLIPDDAVLLLGVFMVLLIHPKNAPITFGLIDLCGIPKSKAEIFLLLNVFRI